MVKVNIPTFLRAVYKFLDNTFRTFKFCILIYMYKLQRSKNKYDISMILSVIVPNY